MAIFILQGIWLYNTFTLIRNDLRKECSNILEEALYKEADFIANYIMPELPDTAEIGTRIVATCTNDSISEYTYLYDGLYQMGLPSLERIDSITGVLLASKNIQSQYFLRMINPRTLKVHKNSKALKFSKWDTIESEIVTTRVDMSDGIQIILCSPHSIIIKRMGLILISTLIIIIFVASCIYHQIKIIILQNKIATIREDFSYAMIHDMKSPLTSIMTTLNLIRTGRLDKNPQIKSKYIEIAENELEQLLALSSRILTISKLESHKLDIDRKPVSLEPIINRLTNKFSTQIEKNISFTVDLQSATVYADEELLKEVLYNLLDNSIKYSNKEVNIKISSAIDTTGRNIIKVCDNGLGIAPKHLSSIFEKFERGDASKRSRKGGATGFGLGLNFVYQAISAHNGNIVVNSVEGEFTEFTIFLPQV